MIFIEEGNERRVKEQRFEKYTKSLYFERTIQKIL